MSNLSSQTEHTNIQNYLIPLGQLVRACETINLISYDYTELPSESTIKMCIQFFQTVNYNTAI